MPNKFLNSKYWLDWIFPNRCPLCNKFIDWDKLLCEKCKDELPYLENMIVKGKCPEAEKVFALFAYNDTAVDGIYGLKHSNGVNFAEYASICLVDFMAEELTFDDIDLVTCVPMSKTKLLDRKYNQAEVFAKHMSKRLGKSFNGKLLQRKHNNIEQHMLSSEQRRENAENVYHIHNKYNDIKGKNILICDDVITTGATMSKCIRLLKEMGADKVYVAAICTTVKSKNIGV